VNKKIVLLGLTLILSFALVACGDDGEQQPVPDGGADAVAGDGHTPQPDVYVPPGCEADCLHEAFYLCSKDAKGKCVECTKDADCTNNPNAFGSKCNGTNKCVCDTDADCKDNLNGGKCDKSGTSPKCTCKTDADCGLSDIPWGNKCGTSRCECKADADCAGNGNGSTCETTYSKCTCKADAECTKAPYTKCNPAYSGASYQTCQKPCNTIGNKCLNYLASAGWPTVDSSLKCDATTGKCAQCNSNADCTGSSPVCDMTTNKCVGCKTAADCANSPDGTFCDTSGTTGSCKCKDDTHCKGGYPWGNKCRISGTTATTGICRCESDANCGGNPNGPKCYTTYNKCTCKTDAECKAPFSSCAVPYSGATYSHCRKACKADGDCPSGLKCNLGNGKCYECKTNADCTGSNKICIASTGACVACRADADCTSTTYKFCLLAENKCVKCKADKDCTGTYKYCKPATGSCIACKTDTDCTGSSKYCKTDSGSCTICRTNAHCAASPDGTFCDTSSSYSNSCKCKDDTHCKGAYQWGNKCRKSSATATSGICRCDTNANCTGNPNGPTCYATYNKCSCAADTQCKKAPYTKCGLPYSSASYKHCFKPCKTDGDCASNTTTKYCLATLGTCVACKTDAHCASNTTNKYCSATAGTCVACKTNAHCAAEQFDKTCDPASGCVECKTDANCGVNSLGNKCSGTICVCATDADCANRNMGHKCDSTACSCAADTDCPTGKKCTGSYLGISICK
jgi:hypothetical protein